MNLEVGGGEFESFIGLAIGGNGTGGLHGDRARRQILRDNYRKSLHAAGGPVIDAGEDRGLMVEGVVQKRDERGIEGEGLLGWARALQLQRDTRHAGGRGE